MSINSVTVSGNLSKDVAVKVSADGIWNFGSGSIGVNNRVKDKNGAWKNQTTWINYKIITKYADRLDRLVKGTTVLLQGRLMTDEYEKDGQTKRFDYLQVEEFEVIERPAKREAQPVGATQNGGADEDIPF